MKFALLGSLPALVLSCAFTPYANAMPSVAGSSLSGMASTVQKSTEQTTPFELVFLAWHGYLRPQGVPSAGKLDWEYQAGDITAEELIKAGIQADRVASGTLNDKAYINAVDAELRDLVTPF